MKLNNIVSTQEDLREDLDGNVLSSDLSVQGMATEIAIISSDSQSDEQLLSDTQSSIEDAFVAEERLGELIELTETTLDKGGVSETDLSILQVSHESIMNSLGLKQSKVLYTSESFKAGVDRLELTKETLENLTSTAVEIGANIIKALKSLLSGTINFISNLLKNRWLLDKHLVAIESKVKMLDKSATMNSEKLSSGGEAISYEGKANPETASMMLRSAHKAIDIASEMVVALKNLGDYRKSAGSDHVEKVDSAVIALGHDRMVHGKTGYGVFTRDRSIVLYEGNIAVNFVTGDRITVEAVAPNRQQMLDLIQEARRVLKSLSEMESTRNRLKQAVDFIINGISEQYSKAKSHVATDGKSQVDNADRGLAKERARIARSYISKAGSQLPGAAFQAVKAVADYVKVGYGNFSTPIKAEDKTS